MNSLLKDRQLVRGLIDVMMEGIRRNRLQDAESILASVRLLRPNLKELAAFDAWIAMRLRRWDEAVRHLHHVDGLVPNWSHSKALLTLCQFATKDPTWQATANDVIECKASNADSVYLVSLLLRPNEAGDGPAVAKEQPAPPSAAGADIDMAQGGYFLRA